ncbi:MAG TPA: cytochrome c peroxidase [Kofleriaceae bacterium]|nr:cytochrome c peroxidase [Kofleriaceae bacterium]
MRSDGFTDAQWTALQKQYTLESPPEMCSGPCSLGFPLGQRLFFEPALSGNGEVSCATCHAPTGWYVDPRRTDVSFGTVKWTQHNTISLVNLAYKRTFTWAGQCGDHSCLSPNDVIVDIALPKAMTSTRTLVTQTIENNPEYLYLYRSSFSLGDPDVVANVATSLHAYMRALVSVDAPFDAYIAGNDSALSDKARRGFALFVGKAMCAECHRGPMFTDNTIHVTGVAQRGEHAPAMDAGAPGFFTPGLRNIDKTAPYMHDGSLANLADVIDFYRRGGDTSGFSGDKDPLMQPVDITDDEARDLEAFLHALTGQALPETLTMDLRSYPPPPTCQLTTCGTACVDTNDDAMNCGGCGKVCPVNKPVCAGGVCGH